MTDVARRAAIPAEHGVEILGPSGIPDWITMPENGTASTANDPAKPTRKDIP